MSLATLVLSSCSLERNRGYPEVKYDLVAEAAYAEAYSEVSQIDFGSDRARVHLISGWSWNEHTDHGRTTMVWGRDDVSVLEFFLAETREVRATFRCSPFTFPEAPGQGINFELDGRSLAHIEVTPGFQEYSVVFPEGSLAAGPNRLHLRYRYSKSPQEVGASSDARRLAVAWDWLRLEPMQALDGRELRTDVASETIFLPYGMEMNFYLELAGRSILSLEGVRMAGNGKGGLRLLAQEEQSIETSLAIVRGPSKSRVVDLPGKEPRLMRVTLRSFGDELSRSAPGGVLITRPEVYSEKAPAAAPARWDRPALEQNPNVVVYVVDTLRADRLGCYGGPSHISPNIDAFAESSIVYERAIAQSSWTKPAVASILTGLTPTVHGANHLESRLPSAAQTLPELLRDSGYRTVGFSTNPNISAVYGFDQGFDSFMSFPQYTSSDVVTREIESWLNENDDAPLFLYVHTMDPHAPYDPPVRFREIFAPTVTRPEAGTSSDLENIYAAPRGEERRRLMVDLPPLYEAEVAFNDQSFGEFTDLLRERRLFDGALIIFLSDHGEEFGEHGSLGHGHQLYSEVLTVPLIVKPPFSREAGRVTDLAQHVDILPTIVSYVGLAESSGLPGTDLLKLSHLKGELGPERRSRPAFSYMNSYGVEGISVVQGDWKRTEPLNAAFGSRPKLFQIARDPGDQADVLDHHPIRAGYLGSLIRRELARLNQSLTAEKAEIDEETRESLEALGYLGQHQFNVP